MSDETQKQRIEKLEKQLDKLTGDKGGPARNFRSIRTLDTIQNDMIRRLAKLEVQMQKLQETHLPKAVRTVADLRGIPRAVACPHCGDTSGDPGHFEDCPSRKAEDRLEIGQRAIETLIKIHHSPCHGAGNCQEYQHMPDCPLDEAVEIFTERYNTSELVALGLIDPKDVQELTT